MQTCVSTVCECLWDKYVYGFIKYSVPLIFLFLHSATSHLGVALSYIYAEVHLW